MKNNTIQALLEIILLLLSVWVLSGCNPSNKRGVAPSVPEEEKPIPPFVTECNAVFNKFTVCMQMIDVSPYKESKAIQQDMVKCSQTLSIELQKAKNFLTAEQEAQKAKEFETSAAFARPAIKECGRIHSSFRPYVISCIIEKVQVWQTQICAL